MVLFTNRLWVRHDQPESEGVNSTGRLVSVERGLSSRLCPATRSSRSVARHASFSNVSRSRSDGICLHDRRKTKNGDRSVTN
jgi:hypothetical protein